MRQPAKVENWEHLRANRACFQVTIEPETGSLRHIPIKRDSRNVTCDVARSIATLSIRLCPSVPGPDVRGKCRLHLRRGMKGLVGPVWGWLQLGDRPRTTWATRDFTFRYIYRISPYLTLPCRMFRVPRLSRVQVSADYFSGSCESDFVVVVTSRTRAAPSISSAEQNRLCAVKFLITVLDQPQTTSYSLSLLLIDIYTYESCVTLHKVMIWFDDEISEKDIRYEKLRGYRPVNMKT